MLLYKKFDLKSFQLDGVQHRYSAISGLHFLELVNDKNVGIIEVPAFFAAWYTRYEGLAVDDSGLIDIRFAADTPWLSIPEARLAIGAVDGPLSIQIRLRRSAVGVSPTLSVLEVGYHVEGSIVAFLNDLALPNLLAAPVRLQRIVQSADSLIADFNPSRLTDKSAKSLNDRSLVSFLYSPVVIASQGEFQGGEIPAVLVRLESQSNRRELGVPQYLRNSINSSLKASYAAVYDIIFDISVIAQRTQDVSMIVDRICQTVSEGRIDLLPFGVAFGISMSSQIVYDEPIRESELATLPTASFNLVVHNVPIGQTSKSVDLITEICPVMFL